MIDSQATSAAVSTTHRATTRRHGMWLGALATACAVWLGVAAPTVSPVAPTQPPAAPVTAIVPAGTTAATTTGGTPVDLVITP